jgi:hypothetical protein
MQSRKHSALETFFNILVGYAAAIASQIAIFPLFGIHVPFETNFVIGGWFSVTSIVRSYTLRRLFARWEGRAL